MPAAPLRASAVAQVQPTPALTWLAPLGTGTATPATFDAQTAPVVEVCAWTGSACSGAPVARFTTTLAGTDQALTVDAAAGRYEAAWSLSNAAFTTRRTYRIRVLQGATELGATNVDVVRGRWALTRTDGTLTPLVSASALPIRFGVQRGSQLVPLNLAPSDIAIPGEYLITLSQGLSDAGAVARELAAATEATLLFVYDAAPLGFALRGVDGADLQSLRADPRVRQIDQNVVMELAEQAPYQTGARWGLDRIDQRDVQLDGRFLRARTGDGVTVYVLDTGIRTTHAEFGGRAQVGVDITPAPGVVSGPTAMDTART